RIVREVDFHVRSHVEGFERDPIVGLELAQKYVRPIHRVVQKPAVAELTEFDEQDHGYGRVGGAKIGDRLGRAVFDKPEIFLFQAVQVIAVVIGDHDIDVDQGYG